MKEERNEKNMKEGIISIHFSHAHRLARRKEGIYEGKGRKEGRKE